MKTRSLVLCFFVFPLIFSACAPGSTPDLGATITAQAMTLDAVNFLATIPSETPAPPVCRHAAIMVEETIPDGSVMLPGTTFLKTWTFRNAGNCAWTTDTIFEYYSGNQMQAADAIHLPQVVQPGQTVVIAVNMVAPQEPGSYRGDWVFREPGGTIFGWGEHGDLAVWVLIRVGSEADIAAPVVSSSCAPTVSVSMDTNCRQGPGIPYEVLGSLLVGETATIVGQYQAGGFWIINNPDASGTCWIIDDYATVSGVTTCLPFILPPPLPTPPPVPTNRARPVIWVNKTNGEYAIDTPVHGSGFTPGIQIEICTILNGVSNHGDALTVDPSGNIYEYWGVNNGVVGTMRFEARIYASTACTGQLLASTEVTLP